MVNQRANALIRELWLGYFNQVLYRQGVISDAAYRQMLLRIHSNKDSLQNRI